MMIPSRVSSPNQSCIANGFDHPKMFRDSYFQNRLPSLYEHSVTNDISGPANGDLFGLDTLRCALVESSRQPASSIMNLTLGERSLSTNPDIYSFDTVAMNGGGGDSHCLGPSDQILGGVISGGGNGGGAAGICSKMAPKLMLDISRAKNSSRHSVFSRSGSSPPFSDSSLSTSSSNHDFTFSPHPNHQNGRSDSPDSEASNSSADSATLPNQTYMFPPLTDQEYLNLQKLSLIHSMSNMPHTPVMQAINMIQSVLLRQHNSPPTIDKDALELEARYHRSAAVTGNSAAQYTWSGKLPKRSYKGGPYSSKVFLGGVPWDITEEALIHSFSQFGIVKVEWPGKEAISQPKGYAYIILENELQVKLLLDSCRVGGDGDNEGGYFFKIPSRKSKLKEVQVIPWSLSDSNYSVKMYQKLDALKTVFVGALHGMMNAESLFHVMDDLFGGVLYAGIDTDKNKYPIGSGRVTFDNYMSYMKAVTAGFVDIKTPKFNKKVQCDPYLEETPCSGCTVKVGPYFCRETSCFRYFCIACWNAHHSQMRGLPPHTPLSRTSKVQQ